MPFFVCCVPSALLASALLFFGFARRWTIVKRVDLTPHRETTSGGTRGSDEDVPRRTGKARKIRTREYVTADGAGGSTGPRQTRPVSREQIRTQRKHIREFITTKNI